MKQYISVRFDSSSSRYTYSAPDATKIQKGDVVVVKDPRGKLKLVQVVGIMGEKQVTYPLDQIKPIHGTINII